MNLDVAVYRTGRFIRSATSRPARRMPDGNVGVVYKGSVYPVHRAHDETLSIIVEDPSAFPDDCAMWSYGQEYIYADSAEPASIRWHVETNVYGHYLVFDGSENLRHDVIARLRNNGFEIVRHAASIRPADDGYSYDWFARLSHDGSKAEVVAALEGLLGRNAKWPEEAESRSTTEEPETTKESEGVDGDLPEATESNVSELLRVALSDGCSLDDVQGILEWVIDGVYEPVLEDSYDAQAQLEIELDDARDELASAGENFGKALQAAASEIREARSLVEQLQAKNDALADNLSDQSAESVSRIEMEQEIAALKQDAAAGEELLSDAARDQARLVAVNREKEDLERQIERLDRDRQQHATAHRRGGKNQRRRDAILAKRSLGAYKRLKFVSGSEEEVIDRFPDPTRLFTILDALDKRERLDAAAISVAPGWSEVSKHIHTGDSSGAADRGRVYFCQEADDNLGVMIDFKLDDKDQNRKFQRLGKPELVQYLEL